MLESSQDIACLAFVYSQIFMDAAELTFWLGILVFNAFQILCVHSCLRVYELVAKHDSIRKASTCPVEWKPFLRPPGSTLPPLSQALLRALTLAPIRFIVILVGVVVTTTSSAFLPPGAGLRVANIGGRFVGYVAGVRNIRFLGKSRSPGEAPLIVVNHVSWIDFIILGSTTQFGFVMSEAVSKAPIVGSGFVRLGLRVGSVILDRHAAKSREAAKEQIAARLKHLMAVNKGERLVIFPEGTLTNGESVVPFKVGSFETLSPVQPLRMEISNLHYSLAGLGTMQGTAFFLCLGPTEMTFTWCDVVKPLPADTPESFAERARAELVRGSKMTIAACGSFRDHLALTASS